MNNLDYGKVFEVLVKETANYVKVNNLKAMVLGISGGIDSTVVAAICHEVSKQTGIPLIGRSLPIKNKSDVSKLVGEAFCNDFKVYRLERSYRAALFDACTDAGDVNMANSYYLDELEEMPSRTPIANGNLQARCRMMYLYDIASRYKGLVMSTDNQTEYQLGFWTIHGDVGDFDPIQDLWKTEVYGLANWLVEKYKSASDGHWYLDMRDIWSADLENEDDTISLEECPEIYYVGGYECDTDRDSAMTTFSDVDIAFLRGKSKWKSGTAENILRRHNMSSN